MRGRAAQGPQRQRACDSSRYVACKPWQAHKKSSAGGSGHYRVRHGRQTGRRERTAAASLVQLTSDVRARIQECALAAADEEVIDRCVGQLQAAARALGEGWIVRIFGSVANGFGTRASDVDAAFVWEEADGDPPAEPLVVANLMKDRLTPVLREQPKFEIVEEVLGANVPILKLRFDGALDVDLSCQNQSPFQNTQLLKAYSSLDDRVRDLGIAVKLWAKAAGVCGACQGHLSSYTFTLLTIYFMQVHQDVRLPCLPPAAFAEGSQAGQSKLAAARSMWSSRLSVGELLFRFFTFYTHDFVWGHEVITVRLGHRLQVHEQFFEGLRGRWQVRLHVEDPYQLERNLHCVLGDVEEAHLREAFSQAVYYIQCGRSPIGLCAGGDDPAAVNCEFEGLATTPPQMHWASPESPPSSPETDLASPEEVAGTQAVLGSSCSGGSSASTRGQLSDTAVESSGDEHQPSEQGAQGVQWWKSMGTVDVRDAVEQSRNEGLTMLIGTSFCSSATRLIATRVAKACQEQVSWQ